MSRAGSLGAAAIGGVALLLALTSSPSAPAQEGLPEGVVPLPEAMAGHIAGLLKEAETYRGLSIQEPVPSGSVDDLVLKTKLIEAFQKDLPTDELRSIEAGLKAFGLIPESLDLVTFFPELLTTQVAGYYDPEKHYLAIVRRDGEAPLPEAGSDDAAQRSDDAVLVHELTHALQDQHFRLETYAEGRPLDDADAARVAVIEGDATLVMMSFFAETRLELLPDLGPAMSAVFDDPGQLLGEGSGIPGTAELAAAPAWFRDTLLFSYFQGFQFCLSARRVGGQALLDKAFSTDPPRSTEQILHPEKWHTKRDDPRAVTLPDLPGSSKVSEGQLGELGVRTFLGGLGKAKDQAFRAAAGWGGDRFGVFLKEGRRLLVWVSEWDTGGDARELQSALRVLGRDWTVQRSGRKVVVTRGELSRGERNLVRQATKQGRSLLRPRLRRS